MVRDIHLYAEEHVVLRPWFFVRDVAPGRARGMFPTRNAGQCPAWYSPQMDPWYIPHDGTRVGARPGTAPRWTVYASAPAELLALLFRPAQRDALNVAPPIPYAVPGADARCAEGTDLGLALVPQARHREIG